MIRLPFDPLVAGVDEAGRGPIAGPVVVAAVLIPEGFNCDGLTDSKQLTEAKREEFFLQITTHTNHAIQIIDQHVIDEINILQATFLGMVNCLKELKAQKAIIDGNHIPKNCPCEAEFLIKGDSKNAAIAAASILAKVTRDRIMVEMDTAYPGYNFASNKGYGLDAINCLKELGPTPIHRRSFEPLKSMVAQPCLIFEA